MAKDKKVNVVISGDYIDKRVSVFFGLLQIDLTFTENVRLDKNTVEKCCVIYEGKNEASLLRHRKIYHVQIDFKNGKRSILEVDDKMLTSVMNVLG